MNILLVDDEKTALRDLEIVVRSVASDAEIATATRVDEAVELFKKKCYEVVFVDVSMPGKNGLLLAEELMKLRPLTNVIVATAYTQYALDALRIFVSGYVLKPVMEEEVTKVLSNLRYPPISQRKGLFVQCFGSFEVFFNGEVVHFSRSQTKEVFAYLIDRKGAAVTGAELRAVIWGDEANDSAKQTNYFSQIVRDLRLTLEGLGEGKLFLQRRKAYSIVPDRIPCDYYLALQQDSAFLSGFEGEYMNQYSWAENRAGMLLGQMYE